MSQSPQEIAQRVLDRHGRTFADAAGIRLTDQPAPLFQLLVLAQLLSARIGAGVAVSTARELFRAGWTTPAPIRADSSCARTSSWNSGAGSSVGTMPASSAKVRP